MSSPPPDYGYEMLYDSNFFFWLFYVRIINSDNERYHGITQVFLLWNIIFQKIFRALSKLNDSTGICDTENNYF